MCEGRLHSSGALQVDRLFSLVGDGEELGRFGIPAETAVDCQPTVPRRKLVTCKAQGVEERPEGRHDATKHVLVGLL